MIRANNTNYLPNSVIIGMAEGYYVDGRSGGYPSPRRPSFHKIMNYLPPQSLIEVRRTEVGGQTLFMHCMIIKCLDLLSIYLVLYCNIDTTKNA